MFAYKYYSRDFYGYVYRFHEKPFTIDKLTPGYLVINT